MYSIKQIIDSITSLNVQLPDRGAVVDDLLFDSRKLKNAATSLFFAIKSINQDGHDYIAHLYQSGVRNFVVTRDFSQFSTPQANFIQVNNTVDALQELAKNHRRKFDLPCLAITGSNGKTIVKEWLAHLLVDHLAVVRSPRSFNSQIGVPLSIWNIKAMHELGIFEAGISKPGEMLRLEAMIRPEIGIMTNIGDAHASGFKSIDQKIEEKLLLFQNCRNLVFCHDHKKIREAVFQAISKGVLKPDIDIESWSEQPDSEAKWQIQKQPGGLNFVSKTTQFSVAFAKHSSTANENLCHAIVAANLCLKNAPIGHLQVKVDSLPQLKMRLELQNGQFDSLIINDSYTSDLNSLISALEFMKQQGLGRKKRLILSDFAAEHLPAAELHTRIVQILRGHTIDHIDFVGTGFVASKSMYSKVFESSTFYSSTDQFLSTFDLTKIAAEVVLVKGARVFKFEKIARLLQQSDHSARLEINLSAIVNNYKAYRRRLEGSTKIMAMVKASSYGSGSHEIARLLQFHRVDYLGVAYTDEGVQLRREGIQLPIMVMNPEDTSWRSIFEYTLEPAIYSLERLKELDRECCSANERVNIHLELETGMHRLGIQEHELHIATRLISGNPLISVVGIFSHLAASDDPENSEHTHEQASRFATMAAKIEHQLKCKVLKHLLNSTGILNFAEYQFDMVRLGIGLHGYDSTQKIQSELEHVASLKASISQIKEIKKGEYIGYGLDHSALKPMKIATVGIGYADGLNRLLSSSVGSLIIRNKKAVIVGNICMDMCMVDVSDIPGASVGDEVIVFGEAQPATVLADLTGTIPYEILTGISSRVKRIYFEA